MLAIVQPESGRLSSSSRLVSFFCFGPFCSDDVVIHSCWRFRNLFSTSCGFMAQRRKEVMRTVRTIVTLVWAQTRCVRALSSTGKANHCWVALDTPGQGVLQARARGPGRVCTHVRGLL